MPAIDKIGGLRVVIYPNDHRPAHVHVIGNGCEAVFKLNCVEGTAELRENYGFSSNDISRIKKIIQSKSTHLMYVMEKNSWSTIMMNLQLPVSGLSQY